MKLKTLIPLASLLLATPALAADAPPPTAAAPAKPEFRGVMTVDSVRHFYLSSPGGARSQWLALGDSFDGWKLKDYREKDATLALAGPGDAELDLAMAAGGSTGGEAAAADPQAALVAARDVLDKMHFSELFPKLIEQQKAGIMAMMRQSATRQKLPPGTTPEEWATFQKKVVDTVLEGMDPASMQESTARIYSEVFTPEELHGLADFYATPSGQAMVGKLPEVQQKTMSEVVGPMLTQVMPKVAQMQRDFIAQQKAKATAASAAAGTAAP